MTVVAVVGLTARDEAASQGYPHTELADKVDELFVQWDREDSPGAAVGTFKDGKILYARGYGVANLDDGTPMTPQTVLRTGSISKQFVAMCIALLAEQGKLAFDDDIRKYLPEMPDYGEPITIDHLLHHTSGIREYLTLVSLIGKPEGSGYVYTPQDLLDMLARQKELDFEPGEKFLYSNSGYFLLAEIVSRVGGMKTSAFAKKHIFDPLGMESTRFHDDPNAIIRNRGIGYSPTADGGYRLDILRLEVIGDLGVITTVEDFLQWDRNFHDNKLGSGTQRLIETMLRRGRLDNGDELSYAHGLEIGDYRGLRTFGHGGSAVGFVAHYMRFPEQRFSVVILSNVSTFEPRRLARKVADLYLADQFTEPPKPRRSHPPRPDRPQTIALSSSELRTYAGSYYSDELDIVYNLKIRDSALVLELRGTANALEAYSGNRLGWGRHRLDFSRDESGEISGFTLQAGSVRNLKFRRTPTGTRGVVRAYDLIVANARIVDGTGNPWFRGDVGIRGNRIAAVGDLDEAQAERTLDARGLVAAPGFIDMHSHASWLLLVDPRAASTVTQGITLVVEGEGESVAPTSEQYLAERLGSFKRFGITPDWRTLADFFERLGANPPTVNFATYVGTSTVREIVVGTENRPATETELREMERLVAEAMEDGALGVYSALMYVPDRFNSTAELVAMARVAARYGGAYQTHQRSEGDALFASLDEVFHIAREAAIRVNVTHLKAAYVANWGKMPEVVERFEAARRAGLDVAADVYPYLWGSAGLLDILPPWAREGSGAEIRRRLRDPTVRERIKRELETPTAEWENEYLGVGGAKGFVILDVGGDDALRHLEGQGLADIAAEQSKDPREMILDIIMAGGGGFISHLTDETDLELALRQPWVAFGTDGDLGALDGPLSTGLTHPRAYGTFPRVLSRYVRERRSFGLEEAIRKSTSLPAQRLGIRDRGLLREGFYADIVIFDPETVADRATYEQPHQYSQGIEYVLVNGEIVLDRGRITDRRPGMVVRGPGYSGGS